MSKQKFHSGEVVQHVASKERGVIVMAHTVFSTNAGGFRVFNGWYTVSTGMGQHAKVRECELEKANDRLDRPEGAKETP